MISIVCCSLLEGKLYLSSCSARISLLHSVLSAPLLLLELYPTGHWGKGGWTSVFVEARHGKLAIGKGSAAGKPPVILVTSPLPSPFSLLQQPVFYRISKRKRHPVSCGRVPPLSGLLV